jgi:hypothetical protein
MLADVGDGRKRMRFAYVWSDSAFGGPAQVNFEIQQAMILFNSHDFGHVQVSVVQQLELAPEIEIDQPL